MEKGERKFFTNFLTQSLINNIRNQKALRQSIIFAPVFFITFVWIIAIWGPTSKRHIFSYTFLEEHTFTTKQEKEKILNKKKSKGRKVCGNKERNTRMKMIYLKLRKFQPFNINFFYLCVVCLTTKPLRIKRSYIFHFLIFVENFSSFLLFILFC